MLKTLKPVLSGYMMLVSGILFSSSTVNAQTANPVETPVNASTNVPAKTGNAVADNEFKPFWFERLPEGDWTLDFTVYGRDAFTMEIASDANYMQRTTDRFDWPTDDLPVHLVRFYWDSQAKKMWGWANGQEIYQTHIDLRGLSSASTVRWMGTKIMTTAARTVFCTDIRVKAGAPEDTPSPMALKPSGLAERGWSRGIKTSLSPLVVRELESLCGEKEKNLTRCYAMAALLVGQRNLQKGLSPTQLVQIEDLVSASLESTKPGGDSSGAALLLPVAIASMSAEQRLKEANRIERWKEIFFAPYFKLVASNKPSPLRDPVSGEKTVLIRGGLISPVQAIAAQAIGDRSVPYYVGTDWVNQIKTTRPDAALAQTVRMIRQDRLGAFPWFLPQINEASPALYRAIMISHSRNPIETRLVSTGFTDVDESLAAKAAYRLSAAQPQDASYFLSLIHKPEIKADVLEYETENSDLFKPDVDAALAEAVSTFKPGLHNGTPVRLLARQAAYNFKFGRVDEARNHLAAAVAKVEGLSKPSFPDEWAIYRVMRDMKDSRTSQWLDNAKKSAIKFDEAADEFGGGAYISATISVVQELAKIGKLEEALTLALTIDEDSLPANRNIALNSIISKLAVSNTPRALQIARQISADKREAAIVNIALKKSVVDFAAGWQILGSVSNEARNRAAIGLGAVAPPAYAPKVATAIKGTLKAHLSRPTHLRSGLYERNLKGLEKLTPQLLAELAPAFAADRMLLARDLFISVGETSELTDDPIWRRIMVTETSGAYSLPWAPDRLTDAISSEESNREDGYIVSPVS